MLAFNARDDRLKPHRANTVDVGPERPKARLEASTPNGIEGADATPQRAAVGGSRSPSISAGERRLRAWRQLGLALDGITLYRVSSAHRDRQTEETDSDRHIELGISKNQATRARALAEISDGEVEAYIAAAHVDGALVTVAGALRHAAVASGTQRSDASAVPGSRRLRAFRRDLNAAPHGADDLEVLEQSADGALQRPINRAAEPDVAAARAALADEEGAR